MFIIIKSWSMKFVLFLSFVLSSIIFALMKDKIYEFSQFGCLDFLVFPSIRLEFEINIPSPLLFQNAGDVRVLSLNRFIMFKDEFNFHFYLSFWTCMKVFELIIGWLWTMCSHHHYLSLCMLVGKQWMICLLQC